MAAKTKGLDFMAIGAHADDVELMAAGTILRLKKQKRHGIIVDLTDASAATRGSAALRVKEAAAAAKILGIRRVNLGLPDAGLANQWPHQKAVIEVIREYRPRILLTHYWEDNHPDHVAAAQIIKAAWYKAGLRSLDCKGEAFRPFRVFHFMGGVNFEPTFCVDISEFWERKMAAIGCYKSQFFSKDSRKFKWKTDIASPEFLDFWKVRGRFYGNRIRREYAEPFFCQELPEVDDITRLGERRF
jgi:bacillithiol biosynthesis deacetylase BshB1